LNSKPKTSAHVVLGLDKEGKPRAALIHPADLEAATKAAVSLGFKLGRADTPQVFQMAKQLPDAKVFATGKGLVPLVRKDIHDFLMKGLTIVAVPTEQNQIKEAAGTAKITPEASKAGATKATGTPIKPDPRLWEQITVGSLVIAPERDAKADGYWPARVTAVKGDQLVIQWVQFPQQGPLKVKRRAVALFLGHS
jgi:hypothetical protein